MRSSRLKSILILFLILCGFHRAVDSKCSRLPSGNCWVSCMQEIYEVTCFNVTEVEIQSDLERFAGTDQQIRLNIWNTANVDRLSADVFAGVADQIISIDMEDVTNFTTFPEFNTLVNLEHLNVWNSPQLSDFNIELLPRNLRRLTLNMNGIESLLVDTVERPILPELFSIMLQNLTLKSWRSALLESFPNLEALQISNCTIVIEEGMEDFPLSNMLRNLTLSSNNFTWDSSNENYNSSVFLEKLLSSYKPLPSSLVDVSNNNITITAGILKAIGKFNKVWYLYLRNNPFSVAPELLPEFFPNLINLDTLDLGKTNIRPIAGMLRHMYSLKTLLLDGNNLGNLVGPADIFNGFGSYELSTLDLSSNNMTELPNGSDFQQACSALKVFDLHNNSLKYLENEIFGIGDYWVLFESLKRLNVSYNNLEKIRGINFQNLSRLEILDLSCNNFTRFSRTFFSGLPESLKDLDISLCFDRSRAPPVFDVDAFSEIPPITILRMNAGNLKKGIFVSLSASVGRLDSLRELHLADNLISYLGESNLPHLPKLKLLNLEGNQLQSVQKHTFGNLPDLRVLKLARNKIMSIGPDNLGFGGVSLQNLEILDFSRNGLFRIDRGSFDNLPKLQALMLGYNPVDVQNLFITGGSELLYFGMEDYNRSCLQPDFFAQLKKLKWIFPDAYNLVAVNPDAALAKRNNRLLSMIHVCTEGATFLNDENYPGLGTFATSTMYDNDDDGMPYPHMAAFMPQTYCPQAPYLQDVYRLICPPPSNLNSIVQIATSKP